MYYSWGHWEDSLIYTGPSIANIIYLHYYMFVIACTRMYNNISQRQSSHTNPGKQTRVINP